MATPDPGRLAPFPTLQVRGDLEVLRAMFERVEEAGADLYRTWRQVEAAGAQLLAAWRRFEGRRDG